MTHKVEALATRKTLAHKQVVQCLGTLLNRARGRYGKHVDLRTQTLLKHVQCG